MNAETSLFVSDFLPSAGSRSPDTEKQRLIAYRRARNMRFGPCMRLHFEDAHTLRHQIREVLRVERIAGAEDVLNEIAAYAHLLPARDQWKATLFIEMPDDWERRRELPALSLAAHHISLHVQGLPAITAQANEDLPDRHLTRPSATHFLRFQLPLAVRSALLAGAPAALACTHERYAFADEVPAGLLARLRADLTGAQPQALDHGSSHVPA
jgi:hypothetical protein